MPELRPLNPQPINLKMVNQPGKVLFETVGKLAGINVLFDPEYTTPKPQSIELSGATLDEALDYLSIITKSFWKPLSANTIFVTQDNTTKRRDYEEQVMKVFYLTNVTTPQELQEIVTAVRSVADIQRLFVYNAQNAIIARGEADRIALAEKIIRDLDKPKSEVIVDILVMQTSTTITKNLSAAITPNGLNLPITFAPRASITTPAAATTATTATTSTATAASTASTTPATTTTPTGTSTGGSIPLAYIGKINTEDFSTVLPSGMLQAVLSDAGTKVLQSPEIRSVDNQKASIKIGEKEPIASGSFQPGVAGVGINPLVNTQFTFIDVGVNVDLTPQVHDNNEVSMHVEIEISSVISDVNLGGIEQPVISQEKVIHDIRMKDGEVSLLAGLRQDQDSTTVTGIPGLSSIPVIKWLFSSKTINKSSSDLLIAIIPHIIRRPDYTEENLAGVAVGNATVVKLNYAPRAQSTDGEPAPPAPKMATPPSPGTPSAPLVTTPSSSIPPVAKPSATPPPATAPPVTAPPGAPPATAPPAAQALVGNATVSFAPGQIDTLLGGPFTANVVMQNATDLFAAPMQIKFDPKVLRLDDVVQGSLVSSDGQQVTFTKNILNDTGEATVALNRFTGNGGVTGSGTLVTLSFTTVGRGATNVSIPGFAPTNSQGQAVSSSSPLLTVNVR